MLHMLRAVSLLLLMALGQVETALALACEPPARAEHEHCVAQHGAAQKFGAEPRHVPHDETPAQGGPHDGPSCAAMLSCSAAVALPSAPALELGTPLAADVRVIALLPPPSRADAPGNPPPRA
jgi:hypothetical protein